MSLTLRDGVYQVRTLLGEHIPNFWYTNDIIYHLNYALQDMCSEAQCIETVTQISWPQGQQEFPLPVMLDKITDVAVFQGQLFQLQAMDDFSDVQIANRVSSIPQAFYTKIDTVQMSPQGTPAQITGNIVPVQLSQSPEMAEGVTVIGLWPIPSATISVTVWGTAFHPFVTMPEQVLRIPGRFIMTPVAWAVARGKEKQGMYDEAQYWQGMHEKGRQEFINYWIMRKQSKTAPSYGGTAWPTLARGSSSVIFVDQNPGRR